MIQSCNEEQLSLAVTLAWCLWNNRNECRHVGRGPANGNWCSGLRIIYWSIKLCQHSYTSFGPGWELESSIESTV